MNIDKIKIILEKIYSCIHPDNTLLQQIDAEAFDLVDVLVAKLRKEGLAEEILENSDEVDLRKIGALFDMLFWQTEDNGSSLSQEIAVWVKSEDKVKVEIALNISDAFPINPIYEFRNELHQIEAKFPELKHRCEFWREAISKQESLEN